jgi:hypothetical protein
MEVDLAVASVSEDDARRRAGACLFVDCETRFGERLQSLGETSVREGEVEVLMRSRLVGEQRIDAPAAVHPRGDSGFFQPVEDAVDLPCVQLLAGGCSAGVRRRFSTPLTPRTLRTRASSASTSSERSTWPRRKTTPFSALMLTWPLGKS